MISIYIIFYSFPDREKLLSQSDWEFESELYPALSHASYALDPVCSISFWNLVPCGEKAVAVEWQHM